MAVLETGDRNNNFDMLRIIAALLVILAHSYPVTKSVGMPLYDMTKGDLSIATIGVIIFFVISGYLITKSWAGNQSPLRFLWKRFLRIIPGLFVALLFTMLIIGPLVTSMPLIQYLTSIDTWKYLLNTVLYIRIDTLPTVFIDNPYRPISVNGSLWTIPIEFALYIMIMVLGILGILFKKI
jgi:peptidoglycan/LPS O-acetylase OafA/YrhL